MENYRSKLCIEVPSIPDPYLWLTDPDVDKEKWKKVSNLWSMTKIKIIAKKIQFILQHYFNPIPLNTFVRKGKDPDADPGSPKNTDSTDPDPKH